MARSTKGNCYLCGAELGKTAMKNHLLKNHGSETGQECRLFKIEGAYDKNYWLYVDIPVDKTLNALDKFLRKIWLECCGHLSEFQGAGKSTKVGNLREGSQFLHLYDFGSTTETLITIIGTTWRPPQREAVRLLARNIPPQFPCIKCGTPALYVDTERFWNGEDPFYCEKCAGKYADEEMLLPVTNSPRMGVCGYAGELDTFAFAQPSGKPASASRTSARKEPRKELRKQPERNVTGPYPEELYELAFAFRSAKPWDRLYEDELFAVPLPSGETGYCSVMGRAGEHLALAVYPGEQGLRSFQRMQEAESAIERFELPNPLKMQEHMFSQLCIQCSLENKDMLQPEELSSARDHAARHGIKFRGSNSFPQFIKYRPAAYPTRVTSEEDIQILCEALRAVLAVNEKLRNAEHVVSEKETLGFSDGLAAARSLPVLTPGQDGCTWSTGVLPDIMPQTYPQPVLRDELLLARLKKAKKRNTTWVCDVVMCPQPVQEEEDSTPVFPYILIAADKKTGTALPPAMIRSYDQEADTLLHKLGEQMLEFCLPRRMIVTDDRTHALLEAITDSLGIELVRTDGDELLEELESEFAEISADGGIDGLDEEDAVELAAGLLMNLDDTALLQLPQPVWESLRAMIGEGDIPVEVKDRFRALDEERRRH